MLCHGILVPDAHDTRNPIVLDQNYICDFWLLRHVKLYDLFDTNTIILNNACMDSMLLSPGKLLLYLLTSVLLSAIKTPITNLPHLKCPELFMK